MLTAKDLLFKSMDFDIYWNNSKTVRSTPPSLARKAQTDCLFQAFGISKANEKSGLITEQAKGDITETWYLDGMRKRPMNRTQYVKSLTIYRYFSYGEFLINADLTQYRDLIATMIEETNKWFPDQPKVKTVEAESLGNLFRHLYQIRFNSYLMFRDKLDAEVNENSRVETMYSNVLQTKLIDSMAESFSEIEKVLTTLIDPANRQFDEKAIGYPEYNLASLDAEYWKANRHHQKIDTK